jgi:hypothetical protein
MAAHAILASFVQAEPDAQSAFLSDDSGTKVILPTKRSSGTPIAWPVTPACLVICGSKAAFQPRWASARRTAAASSRSLNGSKLYGARRASGVERGETCGRHHSCADSSKAEQPTLNRLMRVRALLGAL